MLRKNRDQPYYNKKRDTLRQEIRERILLKALPEVLGAKDNRKTALQAEAAE